MSLSRRRFLAASAAVPLFAPSLALAQQHFPNTAVRGELAGQASFFDCAKAERVLGWRHED